MKNRFFSKRVRFFGNVAIMILCAIFFLVPFAIRGARMAVGGIKNDVKDWLPSDFPETRVLDWFRQYFVGDQFVAVSWPGCSEDDPRFRLLLEKLRKESLDYQLRLSDEEAKLFEEERKAHEFGDELGLYTTGDYHVDWGQEREKWLLGNNEKWYYITQTGDLYRWDGERNVLSGLMFSVERFFTGSNRATGEFVEHFGTTDDNEYYENPQKLSCRFFKTVLTGPDVLRQLAGEGGSLRQGGLTEQQAFVLANQRLTGSLFGPTPSIGFQWDRASFKNELTRGQIAKYPEEIDYAFERYVDRIVKEEYGGKKYRLINATSDERIKHWFTFFFEQRLEPPARTTCLLITLNDPATKDLSRVVGRPVLGKPRGRIQELAINECNVLESDLHLGGPPNDNVAIDEEGTITLIRLVGVSTLVGCLLAYISFRSIRVTFMVFFCGGVSAISSLGIVWYAGSNLDAILMTMPSLIYVLGLSGAVHIVNYYREACIENGPRGAAETAVRHGWFPCTLAAFTTALGLISLYVSSLIPIQKFGLFAAIGTMVTVILLFTYLPSSLQLWPPGYQQRKKGHDRLQPGTSLHDLIGTFWERVANFVIKYHWGVNAVVVLVMIACSFGVFRIQTSVQLIKLFDDDAKVLQDYRWLEANLGRLVPLEIMIKVPRETQIPLGEKVVKKENGDIDYLATDLSLSLLERIELSKRVREYVEYWFGERRQDIVGPGMSTDAFLTGSVQQYRDPTTQSRFTHNAFLEESYSQLLQLGYLKLDNMESVRKQAELAGATVVENPPDVKEYPHGYIVTASGVKRAIIPPDPGMEDAELWRVSLRLGALKNVDYGRFVSDLKTVVEPIMSAYACRNRVVEILHTSDGKRGDSPLKGKVLFVGWKTMARGPQESLDVGEWSSKTKYKAGDVCWHGTDLVERLVDDVEKEPTAEFVADEWSVIGTVDRFAVTQQRINDNKDYDAYLLRAQTDDSQNGLYVWNASKRRFDKHSLGNSSAVAAALRPVNAQAVEPNVDQTVIFCETLGDLMANRGFTQLKGSEQLYFPIDPSVEPLMEKLRQDGVWQQILDAYDCVVLVDDHPEFDVDFIQNNAKHFIDARDHVFQVNHRTKQSISQTAAERLQKETGDYQDISVVTEYTGIVPIVYKAQRSLLNSLVNSIALAFVMIALVMMVLLRDWKQRPTVGNSLNVAGGIISMLPNVFPLILIFGAMGHLGVLVDIGSMMTASVAMGVAVDDTIHFLSWYRQGLAEGLERKTAIKDAYRRCATAMTQTTLIGGLGLAVFAWSTFTPTQRFGVMMLLLLNAALIGDLIFLPALLASPLGKFFNVKPDKDAGKKRDLDNLDEQKFDSAATLATTAETISELEQRVTAHSGRRPKNAESMIRRTDQRE